MKKFLAVCAVTALLGAVSAQGALLEYLGPSGDILQAQGGGDPSPGSSWFKNLTTNAYSALPLPSPITADDIMLRNGSTTTLTGTINDNMFVRIGEKMAAGDVGSGVGGTTLYIRNGGLLKVSDGLTSGTLRIGEDYSASVYVEDGGTILNSKNATSGKPLWVGIDGRTGDPNAQARLYVSGGYVKAANKLGIGGYKSRDGLIELTGGMIQSPWTSIGDGDATNEGGTGVFNIKGGSMVGNGMEMGKGSTLSKGTVNQTGGLSMLTSDGDIIIGNTATGIYSLTGGTLQMGTLGSNLCLGMGDGAEAGTGNGRLILGQGGAITTPNGGGRLLTSPSGATLELLIGSAANFNMNMLGFGGGNTSNIDGALEVTLIGGYTPTYGQEWKVMTVSGGGTIEGTFDSVETDWEYSLKDGGTSLYVKYVPEPAALSLLSLGGLVLIRRRRS